MAVITPIPKTQFLDAAGAPLAGGLVYTYAAGTTTPQASYTDSSGSTANSNPIVLDSRGEANIWLGEANYKMTLCDPQNTEIWTVDYISAPTTALSPILSGNVVVSSNSSGAAFSITQEGGGYIFRAQDSSTDANPVVITSSRYLGIGTVAPAEALDIDNNGKIQFSASGTARTIISADATNSTIDVKDSRNFVVKTNGNTVFTATDGGSGVFTGGIVASGSVTAASFIGPWANIPAGTVMLFVQTSAPTGWTKSTAHNNKALRVVSGSASSGGSVAFTSAFASQAVSGTVASYTLTTADIPSHTHTASVSDPGHTHNLKVGGGAGSGWASLTQGESNTLTTTTATTGITVSNSSTGGGGGHSHGFTGTAINLAVQYVDVIIATKD